MNLKDLLGVDVSLAFSRIVDIVKDPAQNPVAAWLIVAAGSLVVLLVLTAVVAFLLGSGEEEGEEEDEEDYGYEGEESPEPRPVPAEPEPEPEPPAPKPRGPYAGYLEFLVWVAVLAGVWLAAGYATARTDVCVSCHATTVHTAAGAKDPHRGTDCVACHEGVGPAGTLTYMLPPRAAHFVAEVFKAGALSTYGRRLGSNGCIRCHDSAIASTVTIKLQAVRVSHKEPRAAGAECLDCHALNGGAVSNLTVGMEPCLRCHDGKAADSKCAVCHVGAVGIAARPSSLTSLARDQIQEVNCYSCHNPRPCDTCHGMRMPHTKAFMAYGHARQAVVDIWNNAGRTCGKCHYPGRRPCTDCHAGFPNHPVTDWRRNHGATGIRAGDPGNACICHDNRQYVKGRNLCALCHTINAAGTAIVR